MAGDLAVAQGAGVHGGGAHPLVAGRDENQQYAALEAGELSLEQSIALYTEGVKIAGVCNKKLAEAEAQVKPAEEALTNAKNQAAAATAAYQAAEQAAQAAEANAKAVSDAEKQQAAADAAAKRKAADDAKTALAQAQQNEQQAQAQAAAADGGAS